MIKIRNPAERSGQLQKLAYKERNLALNTGVLVSVNPNKAMYFLGISFELAFGASIHTG